jgi:hypothetical protein
LSVVLIISRISTSYLKSLQETLHQSIEVNC